MKKLLLLSLIALLTLSTMTLAIAGGHTKKEKSTCSCDKVKKPRKSKKAEAMNID